MSRTTTIARMLLLIVLPVGAALTFSTILDFDVRLPLGLSNKALYEPRIDRILHLLCAMGLLWLLTAARLLGRKRPTAGMLLAIAILIVLGPAIEFIQERTGRGFEWGDAISHELGLLIGLVVGAGFILGHRSARRGAARRGPEARRLAEATAAKPAARSSSFVGGAKTVSSLTFLSRITGLLRESALASAFGRSPAADAYTFGFLIPNLFRRLFGEGALSAALIPVYADLIHKNRLTAQRLASMCLALLAVILGALTLGGEAILGWLLASRQWSDENVLAIKLAMIMLPYMPMVCLVAVMGSILQVHDRFASTAASPIILNVISIVATLWAAHHYHDPSATAYVAGWAVLVAGGGQLAWQTAACVRVEKLTHIFVGAGESMRVLLRRFAPAAIGLGIFQINTFMDNAMGMAMRADPDAGGAQSVHLFGQNVPLPLNQGDVAALGWAQRLYEFPLGVFGIAIATAIFPALARAAARSYQEGIDEFRDLLRHGLRLTVFIGAPASAGLILVGLPLVRLIYKHGEFTEDDAGVVTWILAGYAPAIWAYSMNHVITRGFYSLGDTRTPLYVSAAMVALNFILNLILVWHIGPAGFAVATALCAILQAGIMLHIISHYVPAPIDRAVLIGWGRTILLTLAMCAALTALKSHLDARLQLPVMVAVGAAVFFGGAYLTRAEELGWLMHRRVK